MANGCSFWLALLSLCRTDWHSCRSSSFFRYSWRSSKRTRRWFIFRNRSCLMFRSQHRCRLHLHFIQTINLTSNRRCNNSRLPRPPLCHRHLPTNYNVHRRQMMIETRTPTSRHLTTTTRLGYGKDHFRKCVASVEGQILLAVPIVKPGSSIWVIIYGRLIASHHRWIANRCYGWRVWKNDAWPNLSIIRLRRPRLWRRHRHRGYLSTACRQPSTIPMKSKISFLNTSMTVPPYRIKRIRWRCPRISYSIKEWPIPSLTIRHRSNVNTRSTII